MQYMPPPGPHSTSRLHPRAADQPRSRRSLSRTPPKPPHLLLSRWGGTRSAASAASMRPCGRPAVKGVAQAMPRDVLEEQTVQEGAGTAVQGGEKGCNRTVGQGSEST